MYLLEFLVILNWLLKTKLVKNWTGGYMYTLHQIPINVFWYVWSIGLFLNVSDTFLTSKKNIGRYITKIAHPKWIYSSNVFSLFLI